MLHTLIDLLFDLLIMYVWFGFLTYVLCVFFFQAEDGIRDLVRSRGLGDVYKRQVLIGLNTARSFPVSIGTFTRVVEAKKCLSCARPLSLIHI